MAKAERRLTAAIALSPIVPAVISFGLIRLIGLRDSPSGGEPSKRFRWKGETYNRNAYEAYKP